MRAATTTGPLCLCAALACGAGAVATGGLDAGAPAAMARALVRPVALPFAWRHLERAWHQGDAEEYFASARQLQRLLPEWSDGALVFAWRFAIDGGDTAGTAAERTAAAAARLRSALVWLQTVRRDDPRHGVELLQSMALLVEVMARAEPGLADRLRAEPGLGDPAVVADGYLAEAERLDPVAAGDRRVFFAPQLIAAFLRTGERARALAIVDVTLARAAGIDDAALAADWTDRLRRLRSWLAGDRNTDVGPLVDDPRFAPLQPFLR